MKSKALMPPPDFAVRYFVLHMRGLRQRDMCAVFHVGARVLKRWKRASGLPLLKHHAAGEKADTLHARARALGYSGLAALIADNAQHGRAHIAKMLGANPDSVTQAAKREGLEVDYPKSPAQIAQFERNRNKGNAPAAQHPWRK